MPTITVSQKYADYVAEAKVVYLAELIAIINADSKLSPQEKQDAIDDINTLSTTNFVFRILREPILSLLNKSNQRDLISEEANN